MPRSGSTEPAEVTDAGVDEPSALPLPPTRPSPTRRRRGRPGLLALLALLILLGLAVLLLRAGTAVRDDLELARSAMERGRNQLLAGEAEAAAASFEEGRRGFEAAEDGAGQPVMRVVGWVPILGRTPDAVRAIAASGAEAAEAAAVLARAVAEVPGGPAGLAPAEGSIPIDRFRPLAEAAERADALMTSALVRLRAAPDSLLLGPVGPARIEAEAEVQDLGDSIHAASSLLKGLPSFLGADGPRRYFFGAQNPAELRGTGGQIGAFSILTIDDGRFRFSRFRPPYSLPDTPLADVPAPNADYAANYDEFRGADRFWTAINVMPDFPSVAEAILISYEAATGTRLDGVIVADPFALSALLEATGPVEIPGYDVRIDADNVVAFTTNEAYSLFDDGSRRKRVLGDAAEAAFERFFALPSHSFADLERLLRAAAERHILAYSVDSEMQDGLQATPVGGTLRPVGSASNFLSVAVSSSANSKVDFYEQRVIRHSIVLEPDGSADAATELVLQNHAPTSGQASYVIGPNPPPKGSGPVGPILRTLEAGESVALVNVYCGADCVPGGARLDGAPTTVGMRVDLGVRYLQHYYSILRGERVSLDLTWDVPHAWEGNSSGGTYRMTFANQVTIRPTELSVRIEPPEGMSIVSASSPMRIEDGAAVYRGVPGSRLDLEVAFRPPLPVRLWRDLMRFLSTPVIRL